MGNVNEFSFSIRLFLKAYRWRTIEPTPWTAMKKPLSQSRLALVSSAGFVMKDQESFDNTVRGGDVSFREIPSDTDVNDLVETHKSDSFDHAGIRQDPNLAFPLDRLRELVEAGRIGSLASLHLSLMGSVTAPGRLVRDTAPEAARRLVEDGVDVALLVPV